MSNEEKDAEKTPQKRKGTFQPGNTAAKRPRQKGVSAAARKFGKKAVKLLQEMALSSRDERVRLQAVQELLRRGYGQIAPAPVAERAAVEGVEPVRDARGVVILPSRDLMAPPMDDAARAELVAKLQRLADAGDEERKQELRELEDLRAEVARLRALVPDAQTAATEPKTQPGASQTPSSARGEAHATPVKLVAVPSRPPAADATEEEAREYRLRRMLRADNATDCYAAALEDQQWMSPEQWSRVWGAFLK